MLLKEVDTLTTRELVMEYQRLKNEGFDKAFTEKDLFSSPIELNKRHQKNQLYREICKSLKKRHFLRKG